MTVRYRPPEDLQHLQVGPIGPHLPGFAAFVSQQGYCIESGWLKVRLVFKLSRWLEQRHIALKELDEARAQAFLKTRQRRLARCVGEQRTMDLLFRYLREIKLVAPPPVATGNDVDRLVAEYHSFLLEERGFMPLSAARYRDVARRFLSRRFSSGRVYLKRLRARDITDFVLHDTSGRGRRSAQLMASVLRSFLRYLLQKRRVATDLTAAVPRIPQRHLADLPRYLEPREVEQVLGSCDCRRKIGKRDHAILLLLARLGLRAGEVAKLTLDDIDWRAGELLVRGKGARVDRLPLLRDVGQALADYLKSARPDCSSRRVFIQSKAPLTGFASAGSVGTVVRAALLRAKLSTRHRGAHILRHSLATGMLRNGATLAQIGQVLRHQLPQTTEIYAKVDFKALRDLALPWPGGAR